MGDMLKQGGCSINPFFPIYKAIFYGYLHNKIMNRQVQQEDGWGLVQSCCLTGSDISQQKLSLSQTLRKQLTYNEKHIRSGEDSHSTQSTQFHSPLLSETH